MVVAFGTQPLESQVWPTRQCASRLDIVSDNAPTLVIPKATSVFPITH